MKNKSRGEDFLRLFKNFFGDDFMADLVKSPTCKVKFDVFLNRDGNICQEGETVAGKKTLTFSGFDSNIPADELINTENSSALHNGVAGLMWLFSGTDENFDTMVQKITTEVVDD